MHLAAVIVCTLLKSSRAEYESGLWAKSCVGQRSQEAFGVQVYGEVLTLAAFPPWLLRCSEIFHAGQLSSFTRAKLHNILWKYCRTSQRFGR